MFDSQRKGSGKPQCPQSTTILEHDDLSPTGSSVTLERLSVNVAVEEINKHFTPKVYVQLLLMLSPPSQLFATLFKAYYPQMQSTINVRPQGAEGFGR